MKKLLNTDNWTERRKVKAKRLLLEYELSPSQRRELNQFLGCEESKKLIGRDKWVEKRKLKAEILILKDKLTFSQTQEIERFLGYKKRVTNVKITPPDPLKELPRPDKWAEKRKLKAEKLLQKDETNLLEYREIIRSWGYMGEVTNIKVTPPDRCLNEYRDIPLLLFLHE